MRSMLCGLVLAGMLATTALAADGANNGGQGPDGTRVAWTYATGHHILKNLGLTAEQTEKINALFKDKGAAQQAMYKNRPKGQDKEELKKFYAEVQQKARALEEEFNVKVMDLLTADQKAKYQAAEKAQEEYNKAMLEANVKATCDREDALLKIYGDSYKAEADRIKDMIKNGEAGGYRKSSTQ